MISDYLSYVIVGITGFTSGAIMQFGILKVKGRKVVIPFIESSSRNLTMLAIVLGLMSLFTIVQVDQSSTRFEDCQVQFQEALRYNTDLTSQERDLTRQKDRTEEDARKSIVDFVFGLTNAKRAEERSALVQRFLDDTKRQNDLLAEIEHERGNLTANRAPYPEPRCGL